MKHALKYEGAIPKAIEIERTGKEQNRYVFDGYHEIQTTSDSDTASELEEGVFPTRLYVHQMIQTF